MELLRAVWRRYRSWRLWVQIVVAVIAVSIAVAPFSEDEPTTVRTASASKDEPVEDALPRATTTEYISPPTTSTTVEPVTTTAPPTTAAPPTTPPPPSRRPRPTYAEPEPAPEPEPAAAAAASGGRCHSSYEGTCIPPDVSDADCAGGSGNGPWYVQESNIRVVGPDVFDLDRDGNGIGCES